MTCKRWDKYRLREQDASSLRNKIKSPFLDLRKGLFYMIKSDAKSWLIPDAAPDFFWVNFFVRIEFVGFSQKDIGGLRDFWIGNAAVINRANGRTLRFIEMTYTFRASFIRNDVNRITISLAFPNLMVEFFGGTACFKNGFIGAFREACATINAFFGDQ